jgi:hypothetical protein
MWGNILTHIGVHHTVLVPTIQNNGSIIMSVGGMVHLHFSLLCLVPKIGGLTYDVYFITLKS